MVVLPALCMDAGKGYVWKLMVIALNPRDGTVAWRYERELPPGDVPTLTVSPSTDLNAMRLVLEQDADTVDDVVLAQATGRAYPQHHNRGKRFTQFTADGYLTVSNEDDRKEYRWTRHGGGADKRATVLTADGDRFAYLPLKDSMLVATAKATPGKIGVRLDIADWGTAQHRHLSFDVDGGTSIGQPLSMVLRPAAGTIVITARGSSAITGLT
ncbi:hypothetical protein [Nonomuraea candida]|uniref:hypothetical protein n=1 Tax=Nonomuraea candida TaxID=359159 RepID=UPI0005BC987B|nr:hypothetical protein [Nonomuraea candida]